MSTMKLHWGSGSPPCMKVIMVLAEKDQWTKCTNVLCQFSKKEHKSEEILKTNPRGQVPTFVDGDICLNESMAICMYLDGQYSPNSLIPADKKERAMVLQRLFETQNISSNVTLPLFYHMMRTPKQDWDLKLIAEKTPAAHTEFQRWNDYLGTGDFLVGNKFTMADLFLYNDISFYVRQGLNLAKLYPNLESFYQSVKSRPSAVASYPPHWAQEPSKEVFKDFNPVAAN